MAWVHASAVLARLDGRWWRNVKSGIVVLLPEERALSVSGPRMGYARIRVFDNAGNLLGSMFCSDDGHVNWFTPPWC